MTDRPELPSPSAPNYAQRVRETLMTYLGVQGDPLNRGVTLRDLIENGFATLSAGWRPGGSGVPSLKPGSAVVSSEVDLTPPPTPEGFMLSAAISHVFIECGAPAYTQGHGHLRTRVYGVTHTAGTALPTFTNAIELGQFGGQVWAMPSNPATTWRLWVKWESVDGVLSTAPAGGTNGLEAVTGQDVGTLLTALTGEITESQLYADLGDRINLVDGPDTLAGSVAMRVKAEATARGAAIASEAYARETEDGNLAVSVGAVAAVANSKNKTYTQATAPTGTLSVGDLWIDAAKGRKLKRYDGTAWQDADDTRIATAAADVIDIKTARIGYCQIGGAATDHTTKQACETDGGTWNVGLPFATAVRQVTVSDGATTATLEQRFTSQKATNGALESKYTVKVDVNGYVSGFGLASAANNGVTVSDFAIRSDKFYIASPSGPGVTPAMPFIVQTTATTINGVAVPVGVYMNDAFIQNGTITNAKIANLAVDDAKIASLSASKINAGFISADRIQVGSLDAKIAYLDAAVISSGYINLARIADGTITFAKIENELKSTNFATGSSGWRIAKDGTAEFNNAVFRGTVDLKSATSGARMEMKNNYIKVFDASGNLRVKIGDLSA